MINWDDKWTRLVIHLPHGAGISFLLMRNPVMGIVWAVLCIIYQIIEDWRIKDNSYLDWRGYMVGFWIPLLFKGIMGLVKWVM